MLIVSSDSDDRRLLDSSDESDASDNMDNSSDDNNASDDIDMALNFFCLSIGDTKGRCLLIGKGRSFKSLFLMPRCVIVTVTCQTCTNAHFFSMGLKRSCACSFVHLKMHKCTVSGTPSHRHFISCRSRACSDLSHCQQYTASLTQCSE